MSTVSIVVTKNDFPRIASRLSRGVDRALDLAAVSAIEVADPLTRRDTGALVNNKSVEKGAESRTVHWHQNYAAFQNGGTRYQSGTHFADKGADAGLEVLMAELKGIF